MHAEQVRLFDLGLDLRNAEEVKQRIMGARGYAKNTLINYASNWRSVQRWCFEAGRDSLPATPATCIDHAAWCIAEGLRLETAHLRLKAINHYHREAGFPLPFDESVRLFLRNARRQLCEKPQGMAAVTPEQLRSISRLLRRRSSSIDIRDRAIILLCFASGWRRSELVSLDVRDIKWVDKGIVLRLGKSKTDQEGRGRSVGVHYGRGLTCPVRALEEWIAARDVWPGPLFVRMGAAGDITHERIASDIVRRAVKRALEMVGEDPTIYGAHSLRAGMITAAVEKGASETAIMQRTGHKSYETLRRYVRPAQALQCDPLAGVL